MSLSRRKRASLVMLLILAAGLVLAGAAAASVRAQETGCCPAGMESGASGCTFLGAGDCCPERPNALAPSATFSAAPPSAPVFSLPVGVAASPSFTALTTAPIAPRTSVLRL